LYEWTAQAGEVEEDNVRDASVLLRQWPLCLRSTIRVNIFTILWKFFSSDGVVRPPLFHGCVWGITFNNASDCRVNRLL